jgi:two-component system, NarL family, invasion response regulator UvrY
MKKFLLVDDHVVVRSGIKLLLLEIFKPSEIYEAADGETALQKLKENSYDVVILDIQMPKTDTIGLMDTIATQYPGTKVLIFSMSAEKIYAKRFLKAGAKGFVSKEAPLEEIIKAVNQILNDRRYISDSLADFLADESLNAKTDNPFNRLSAREFEIASMLLNGGTISSISKTIDIRVSTVGTHKTRLFEKLGVNNLLELKELANNYNV